MKMSWIDVIFPLALPGVVVVVVVVVHIKLFPPPPMFDGFDQQTTLSCPLFFPLSG